MNLYNSTGRLEFADGQLAEATASYSRALNRARVMDDPSAISLAAYHVAICRAGLAEYDQAIFAAKEAEHEALRAHEPVANILLVEARIYLLKKDAKAAEIASGVLSRDDAKASDAQKFQANIIIGLSACQAQNAALAQKQIDAAQAMTSKPVTPGEQASIAGLAGELHLLKKDFEHAFADFDAQATAAKNAKDYRTMNRALAKAGRAAMNAKKYPEAADRLYRAARAATARGSDIDTVNLIAEASAAAHAANDSHLVDLIHQLVPPATQPTSPTTNISP